MEKLVKTEYLQEAVKGALTGGREIVRRAGGVKQEVQRKQ